MNITELPSLFFRLDATTQNHSVRVALICRELEKYLTLPDKRLSTAALVHDIGKVYISPNILDKLDGLTRTEKEVIDLHSYIGFQILGDLGITDDIRYIILYHHRYDPPTLSKVLPNNDPVIREYASILHTVDIFEAINSDRSYHRGLTLAETEEIIEHNNTSNVKVIAYLREVMKGNIKDSVVHRAYKDYQDEAKKIREEIFNELIKDK